MRVIHNKQGFCTGKLVVIHGFHRENRKIGQNGSRWRGDSEEPLLDGGDSIA